MTITLNTILRRPDRSSTDYLVIREYDLGPGSDVVRDPLLATGHFGSRQPMSAKVMAYKTRKGAERACLHLVLDAASSHRVSMWVPPSTRSASILRGAVPVYPVGSTVHRVDPRYSVCTAVEWDQWLGAMDQVTGAPVVAVYSDGSVDLLTGFAWHKLESTTSAGSAEERARACQVFVDQEMPNPSESQRARAAYFMAGFVRTHFGLDESQFWPIFCSWNDRNAPPLSEVELRQSLSAYAQYLRDVAAFGDIRRQIAAQREEFEVQAQREGLREGLRSASPNKPRPGWFDQLLRAASAPGAGSGAESLGGDDEEEHTDGANIFREPEEPSL